MTTDPRVGRLVARWRQLRLEGRAPSIEELCADCPELRGAVGRQINALTGGESVPAGAARSVRSSTAAPSDSQASRLTARFTKPPADTDPYASDVAETLHTPAAPAPSSVPPTVTDPDAGDSRVIRGYTLLERLGGGTFGVVYKALSSGGVEVAVKEIRFSLDHPQSRRELEALELIKRLRHPYLLALHDFWAERDRLYMAMELADSTLAQRAAEAGPGGIPLPELLQIFEEAAETLDFLHEQHVLHRDIKPANILLLGGHTKVADLGLAKFNPDEVAVSQTVAGTPAYMAPESFNSEFRAESDQYALALCYAEMRLGRTLCEGMNTPAVIAWHLYGKPNLEGLKPHEAKAVGRALSKKPTERFPSCRDFVCALHEPAPAPRRQRGWLPVVALLAALPVAALAAWRFWPAPPAPPNGPPPPAKLDVDWAPEENGFVAPAGTKIATAGARRYYDRIVRKVGGREVTFLLVPQGKGDERSFYVMENKVSNGLFKTAAADPEFGRVVAKLQQEYTTLKWGEWSRGGVRNGNQDVGDAEDDLPLLRANVMEAYAFARWMGGDLPTADEWDRAAGKQAGAKEIYLEPEAPLRPGDVAVGRRAEGPMPVGAARRDVSPLGCHDMAGDGMEWTRNLDTGESVPRQAYSQDLQVVVRGQPYYRDKPFNFKMPPDWRSFQRGDPAVGFRVVVEP